MEGRLKKSSVKIRMNLEFIGSLVAHFYETF